MNAFKWTVRFGIFLLCTSFAVAANAASYAVTDLSAKFPNATGDFAINNAGHLMGHAVDQQSPVPNKYTFIYANGAITRLASPTNSYAESLSFNDNDEMTGNLYQYAADGMTVSSQRIFLYKNGQLTDITDALPKEQSPTNIQAINNAGLLLGNYSGHASTVYLYDSINGQQRTVMYTYGALQAAALSNAGHVTGQAFFNGLNHAFFYNGSSSTELASFASPRDSNDYSYGLGINDAGNVVGYAGTPSGNSHAFLYQSGVMTDLGTLSGLGSSANDINNAGIIVGTSQISPALGDSHAFIYASNAMTDLNTLVDPADPLAANIVLVSATAINDRGEILVQGHYTSGQGAKFLLTPAQTPTDTAYYNFEQTTHGWYNDGENIVSLTSSSAQKFVGADSLAVQFNGSGYVSVGATNPPTLAGKTVTFHIYLPADSTIEWVQPFALEGDAGGWAWHGNWQSTSNLQLGAWNTVTVDVPADAQPIYRLGVELYTSQPFSGAVYVDSVSF